MALPTVESTCGVWLVSAKLAQSDPGTLVPGRPDSQNWTPCGEVLDGSFHSTKGAAVEMEPVTYPLRSKQLVPESGGVKLGAPDESTSTSPVSTSQPDTYEPAGTPS